MPESGFKKELLWIVGVKRIIETMIKHQPVMYMISALLFGFFVMIEDARADTESDIRIGLEALNDGQYETAFRLFNNVLENPEHPLNDEEKSLYLTYRGASYILLNQLEKALADLGEAIQFNPREARAHYRYGQALMDLEKSGEAILHFDRALELKPDYLEALLDRAVAYKRVGDTVRELEDLKAALAIDRKNFPAHLNLGMYYLKLKNYEAAIKNLDLCIQYRPNVSFVYVLRGAIYEIQGQTEKAYADIRRAYDLGNRSEEVLDFLGRKSGSSRILVGDFVRIS